MKNEMDAHSKINFKAWLILFALLLAAVPTMIYLDQRNLAKGIGVVTLLVTVFAIRRWMYVIRKRSKVGLNLNDRFWMKEHIPFYAALTKRQKKIFEDRVALFISEIVISEIGKDVSERETCLYVAASAVIPFFEFPFWNYGRLTEVVVYPNQIDLDFADNDTVLVLSFSLLIAGFMSPETKQEERHREHTFFEKSSDEIGVFYKGMMNRELYLTWIYWFEREFLSEMENSSSVVEYAVSGPTEFFVELIKNYQESPELLKREHVDLFVFMSNFMEDKK